MSVFAASCSAGLRTNSDASRWRRVSFPLGARGLDLPPAPPNAQSTLRCSDSAPAAKAASLSLRLLRLGSLEGVVLG